MDKKNITIIVFVIAAILVSIGFLSTKRVSKLGGAPSGLALATSSIEDTVAVSSTVATIFSANLNCGSRIIGTGSTTIMISFGSSTPSNARGFWQGASSTVSYDAGLFGCGQWRAIGLNQSGSIAVTEFR